MGSEMCIRDSDELVGEGIEIHHFAILEFYYLQIATPLDFGGS